MEKNANTVKEISRPAAHLSAHAIGREAALKHLHQRLLSEPLPLVITGVGGLGKTTFAQLYWQRHKADYQHIVWVSVYAIYSADGERRTDNAERFTRAFTDNQQLRRNLELQFDPQQRPVEHFQEVIYRLAELPGENLLVIDNAPEAAAVYAETLSQLQHWRILLTSRDAIQNMAAFRLDTLALEEAAALFQRMYEAETHIDALIPILSDIGHHTLTIELLAAYAREKKLTIPALHQLLRQKGLTHLDDYEVSTPRSHKMQDIAAHLRDVFFLELTPAEQEIMRYCAILPTANVPLDPELASEDFLCALFDKKETENDFKKCLRRLARMNWLVEKEGGYRCHPVIAETAKEQLRPDVVNCGGLVDRVTKLLIPDEATHEPILKRARYAPLGGSVFENLVKKDGSFKEADGETARLAGWLSQLFSETGELYKALEHSKWVASIREKILPSEHFDLAISYNNLAVTYGDLGEHQNDLVYTLKALAILEKILPPENLNLATSYNNLAETYRILNEYQLSLTYHQKSLAIREKILPPEHLDLAQSFNNFAVIYAALGEHQQSLEYMLKTLTIFEKILPVQHPDLAKSYNNLAETYRELNEYQQSLAYHQKALAIREKILSLDHPHLALSYTNLAQIYRALNEHEQSLAYTQKALIILEKTLPVEHPDIILSYNNLAVAYGALGKHEQRLVYNQKALAARKRALPPEHPDLAISYNNLSWTYYDLGDLQKAIDFMRQALVILEKSLPSDHPNTIRSKKSLAFLEEKLGEV